MRSRTSIWVVAALVGLVGLFGATWVVLGVRQPGVPAAPAAARVRDVQGPDEPGLPSQPLHGRETTDEAEDPLTEQRPPTADRLLLQGRVLTEAGTPLVEARASLRRDGVVLAEAFSMPSGKFELELAAPPAGPVELWCEAPGHCNERIESVVVPGRYEVTLRSAARSVCGLVLGNRFEEPIPGARVHLLAGTGGVVAEQETDDHGRFCFLRLGEGVYRCAAGAPGFAPGFAAFALAAGENPPELVVRLGWTDRFTSLQVIEAGTSRPVEGATVGGTLGEAYRTDAAGQCALPTRDEGVFLEIAAAGFCAETFLLRPGDPAPVVELDREQDFAVLLSAEADLFPVEATMIQQVGSGPPDRKRSCRLEPLSDGRVLAVASGLDSRQPATVSVLGPWIRPASCPALPRDAAAGLDDLPVCRLEAGLALRGMVQDARTGTPIAGAEVVLFERGEFESRSRRMSPTRLVLGTSPSRATTDSSGAFVLRGLAPGALDLIVLGNGHELVSLPIQLPAPTDLLVPLAPREGTGGALGGRFLSADETPWPHSIVLAIDAHGFRRTTMSDADGRFRFADLPPGLYKLGGSVLQGIELETWVSKEPYPAGRTDLVVRTPWGRR